MRPLVRVTYWSNSIGRGDGPAVVGRQFLVPGASPHRAGDGRADGVGGKRQVLRLMEGPQFVRVPARVARGGAGLLLELLLLLCWQVSPRKVRVADNLQRDHAGLSDLLEDQRARREAERTVRWPWRALRMLLSLARCLLHVVRHLLRMGAWWTRASTRARDQSRVAGSHGRIIGLAHTGVCG